MSQEIKIDKFALMTFKSIDENRDGFISIRELYYWICSLSESDPISIDEMRVVWKNFSKTNENRIDIQSFGEFFSILHSSVIMNQEEETKQAYLVNFKTSQKF